MGDTLHEGSWNAHRRRPPRRRSSTTTRTKFDPQRLTASEALTCDQNHSDTAEQRGFDGGKMDDFVQNTETDACIGQPILFGAPGPHMDYYDGNTVTAWWNYV